MWAHSKVSCVQGNQVSYFMWRLHSIFFFLSLVPQSHILIGSGIQKSTLQERYVKKAWVKCRLTSLFYCLPKEENCRSQSVQILLELDGNYHKEKMQWIYKKAWKLLEVGGRKLSVDIILIIIQFCRMKKADAKWHTACDSHKEVAAQNQMWLSIATSRLGPKNDWRRSQQLK